MNKTAEGYQQLALILTTVMLSTIVRQNYISKHPEGLYQSCQKFITQVIGGKYSEDDGRYKIGLDNATDEFVVEATNARAHDATEAANMRGISHFLNAESQRRHDLLDAPKPLIAEWRRSILEDSAHLLELVSEAKNAVRLGGIIPR